MFKDILKLLNCSLSDIQQFRFGTADSYDSPVSYSYLISAELTALKRENTDIAVPKTQFGYEPFHGVYRRKTCLPAVLEALQKGETRATSWFGTMKVTEFTPEMIAEIEPRGGCFINTNTPQELADIERKIVEGGIKERESFVS